MRGTPADGGEPASVTGRERVGSVENGASHPDRRWRDARLGDADVTYWFLHRALRWDVVLQLTWVMDGPIGEDTLALLNHHLAAGRLHRRLVVPRIPGARPRWTESADVPALIIDDAVIEDGEADSWAADEMATVRLDAEGGRCWRLRAASCASGATALSLCALHLVADGRTLVSAAAAAMAATDSGSAVRAMLTADQGGRWVAPAIGDPVGDLRDAWGQFVAVAGGLARVARSALHGGDDAPQLPRASRAPIVERSPHGRWVRATAACPATEWDRVAGQAGGTANSLFIATVTGLLRASGYAPVGEPIKVGIPVDRRTDEDDPRTNATAGVSIGLTDDPVPGGDLRAIRGACKSAFATLSTGRRSPIAYLQPMVWFVPPAWLVGLVTAGDGMPDAMVSNLGEIPDAVTRLGGRTARRCSFRGAAQGVDPDLPYRFGDGVQSWLLRTEDRITFSVFGCDEQCFDSDENLRTLLDDELTAWGLTHEVW